MEIIISVISLIIAAIALIVSIISYFYNKARHNLSQLQEQFFRFTDKFEILLDFANYNTLINFKYDLENALTQGFDKFVISYNNLQKEVSVNIDLCKKAYTTVMENMGFFEGAYINVEEVSKSEFVDWLNKTLNAFNSKLNTHYTSLYDINELANLARGGVLKENADKIIKDFYCNIFELVMYWQALLVLKKEMIEVFNKVRINNLQFFNRNASAIYFIDEHMRTFIKEYGIQELIEKHDNTKISSVHTFNIDEYIQAIDGEEKQYRRFLHMLVESSY